MRAVGYRKSLPIDDPQSLIDIEVDKPLPQGRDLLVQVKAISVNPVDYKVRKRAAPKDGEPPKILGFDATGVVAATGPDASLFKAGDEVWYAGSIVRQGTAQNRAVEWRHTLVRGDRFALSAEFSANAGYRLTPSTTALSQAW